MYKDLFDFCERVDPRQVPKAAIEKLIKSGAMDCFGGNRARLMAALSGAVQGAVHKQGDLKRGQGNLFDIGAVVEPDSIELTSNDLPDVPPWPETEKLKYEKEVLDFFFSNHPLAVHERDLTRFVTHRISELAGRNGEEELVLAGLITGLRPGNTKKPRNGLSRFLRFKLEDMTGSCDCVIWPDDLAKLIEEPINDEIYYVKGRLETRGDQTSVIVNRIMGLELAKRELAKALYLRLHLDTHQGTVVDLLGGILKKASGSIPVFVKVQDAKDRSCTLKLSKEFDVNPQKVGFDELETLLGVENVRLG
jgi:DNA polymerase-3 subunit alpha